MSTSWKVVSMAVVFCASLSLDAILRRIRDIFVRRSSRPPPGEGAAAGGVFAGSGFEGAAFGEAGADGAGAGLATFFGASAWALGDGAPPGMILQRGLPTSAVSPSFKAIDSRMPDSCALTSIVILSVSMLTSRSPFLTKSPTLKFHSIIEPSVMLSAPKSGTFISTGLPDAAAAGAAGAGAAAAAGAGVAAAAGAGVVGAAPSAPGLILQKGLPIS